MRLLGIAVFAAILIAASAVWAISMVALVLGLTRPTGLLLIVAWLLIWVTTLPSAGVLALALRGAVGPVGAKCFVVAGPALATAACTAWWVARQFPADQQPYIGLPLGLVLYGAMFSGLTGDEVGEYMSPAWWCAGHVVGALCMIVPSQVVALVDAHARAPRCCTWAWPTLYPYFYR